MWVLVVYDQLSDTVYVYGGKEEKPWTVDEANEAAAKYVQRHIGNKGEFSSDTIRMTVTQIETLENFF